MQRHLLNSLYEWKKQPLRKPLLLRGARQVGKSWLVHEFAKTFETLIEINFDRDRTAKTLFEGDLQIPRLIERISLYAGRKLQAGSTLLFLDEIQECEPALQALRYFKEEFPELHVIAAGSLIEFTLAQLGLPVGRIQFLHLHPLSFAEFLTASGHQDLREHLHSGHVDPLVHDRLLEQLQQYLWLGGMPAVVRAWLDHRDVRLCQQLQDEILQAYRQDFQKYARRRQITHVEQVFTAIPTQLGQKFTCARVDPQTRAGTIKQALTLLTMAGIARLAYHTSGQGIPLGATKHDQRFKVFFFDVGLAQRLLGLDMKTWITTPLTVINVGAIAEQFVAQEFVAYADPTLQPELFYWHREAATSNAEVDFLVTKGHRIIPVEVKSGQRGGLKSLHLFLASHPHSSFGCKLSEHPFAVHDRIHDVPLYGIEAWLQDLA
ncbi:MAG: ATP-binding protein [Deltaproteobacteria bacterium]|nr:ATP-binding protein [Deltaproteobacteria bacterium]